MCAIRTEEVCYECMAHCGWHAPFRAHNDRLAACSKACVKKIEAKKRAEAQAKEA